MIKQEIVEQPNLAQLATVENPTTKGTKQVIKKKTPMNWGLLALGGVGVISWLWEKKKREKALILARQTQLARAGQLRTQQQSKVNTQKDPSGNGNSPEARLSALGVDTGQPGAYQGNEIFKEI